MDLKAGRHCLLRSWSTEGRTTKALPKPLLETKKKEVPRERVPKWG